jgi:putative peptidoglycan lipid II flippase
VNQLQDKHVSAVPAAATATFLVMLGNILSKLTGFIREVIIAPVLGYGVNTDAYTMGFQIPDLFYQLLIGGAIAAVLTPTLAAGIARGRERQTWRGISIFINAFVLAMLVANVAGIVFAPALINLYSRNHSPEVIELAVRVTRTIFPQTLFLMMAGLCVGVVAAYRQFAKSAFSSTIYNIACIAFIVIFGSRTSDGPVRVAAGVALAAFINFTFMFLVSRREFRFYRVLLDLKDPGFRRLVQLAIPTLLSGSVAQINSIVLTHFADQFSGAVTSLRYAAVTWNLPFGIFTLSIGSVMLPSLSAAFARRDTKRMRSLYTDNLRRALFLVAPFSVLFFFMGKPTIQAIFQWGGVIPAGRLQTTGHVLQWYGIALIVQTIIQITYMGFYARRVTKIALVTSLISLILNPLFCVLYVQVFGMGVEGLSLAYTTNAVVQMLIMQVLYRRHMPQARPYRLTPFFARLLFCMGTASVAAMALNTLGLNPVSKMWQLFVFAIEATVVAVTFLLTAKAIELKEAEFFRSQLLRLLKRG